MHIFHRALLASAFLLAALAAPATAQWHNAAAGYGGGFATFGGFTEGGEELSLDAGWIANLQMERWYGSRRVGARLNGAYTQRPLAIGEAPRDIDTWMIDGNLLLRVLPAAAERSVAPFLSVGGGVVHYGLGTGPARQVGENAFYAGDDELRWAVVGGFGFDILPAGLHIFGQPTGIRLEVADHVALESPFVDAQGEAFGPVHNIRVTLGLIGLAELGW